MPTSIITATAPIRICDIGGWTDTWVARRGKVFNIAVSPLVVAQVELFPRGRREARVVLDVVSYGLRYAPALDGPGWGPHPLLEAALRAIPPPDHVDIEVSIRSDAPAGASTGTSAAVLVALLGALDRLAGGGRTAAQIASEAHAVETQRLGRQSGVQDQLCSALGGINFIEISRYPQTIVSHLEIPETTRQELDRRLALIYLGRPHSSSMVHETVVEDLARRGPDWAPLEALRIAAEHARDALVAGDLDGLGRAMRDNTAAQMQLHPDLVHDDAKRVFKIVEAHGAAGWKVNGAGGAGGSITLLCGRGASQKLALIRAIEQDAAPCRAIPIAIQPEGLHVS